MPERRSELPSTSLIIENATRGKSTGRHILGSRLSWVRLTTSSPSTPRSLALVLKPSRSMIRPGLRPLCSPTARSWAGFKDAWNSGPGPSAAARYWPIPAAPDCRDRLNRRVKHRESFRPFGASILAEDAADWFEIPDQAVRGGFLPGPDDPGLSGSSRASRAHSGALSIATAPVDCNLSIVTRIRSFTL